MNMRKYYHLLTLRRSKGLLISNNRTINHRHSHPQPPPPPPPPSPFWYSRISKNLFTRNVVSNLTKKHYHLQLISKFHTSELPVYEDAPLLDYRVTVKSRDVVKPDVTPGSNHRLTLSNLDLLLPPIEAGLFFCYEKKENMSPETVIKVIKTSLAKVLSTFYPLAGEIVSNSRGEPEVFCNNGGVEFVHAHADVDLRDLDFYHPDNSVMGKLVPTIYHGVLSVQATELNCGSIILSCSFKHQLADAYSMDMFLVAWAKSAQLEPISKTPSFRSAILNPRHPPRYESSLDNLYIPISSLPPPSSFEDPLYSRMYYIRAKSIEHLQSEASTKETKISKLLSFTAFLWKLLAHGDNNAENTTSRMGIVVNGRRRFQTRTNDKESLSLETHFGNVLSVPYGREANNDLKEMALHEVAARVNKFVAATTNEEHFRGLVDWVELHRPTPTVARIYFGLKKSEGEAVVVSGGQGLPINDMDFGWGKPVFGSYHFPWGSRTGYVTTMPSASKKGDWVVYMHLKQKDLDVIERLAPNVFTPLSISTFL